MACKKSQEWNRIYDDVTLQMLYLTTPNVSVDKLAGSCHIVRAPDDEAVGGAKAHTSRSAKISASTKDRAVGVMVCEKNAPLVVDKRAVMVFPLPSLIRMTVSGRPQQKTLAVGPSRRISHSHCCPLVHRDSRLWV